MASLSNPSAIAPTFLVDLPGTYVAQLTVTDSHNLTSNATVTIRTQDLSPIAVAGDAKQVAVGNSVHLDAGRSSDPSGDAITFGWTILSKPGDSSTVITAPDSVTPWFVVDAAGTYVVQLAATDTQGNASYSTQLITTEAKPPIANAGTKKSVGVSASVTLSGSASTDANGSPLSYHWALLSRPNGSNVTIPADSNTPTISFIADQAGEYLVELIVSNGVYTSEPSTVLVTAAPWGTPCLIAESDCFRQPTGSHHEQPGWTDDYESNGYIGAGFKRAYHRSERGRFQSIQSSASVECWPQQRSAAESFVHAGRGWTEDGDLHRQ